MTITTVHYPSNAMFACLGLQASWHNIRSWKLYHLVVDKSRWLDQRLRLKLRGDAMIMKLPRMMIATHLLTKAKSADEEVLCLNMA